MKNFCKIILFSVAALACPFSIPLICEILQDDEEEGELDDEWGRYSVDE